MTGLYIGSTTGFAGKNLLTMVLGLKLQQLQKKLAFMKPVSTLLQAGTRQLGDEDAYFVQEVLGLKEDLELVTPVLITPELQEQVFSQGCPDLMHKIIKAYRILGNDKDVILVAGSGSFLHDGKYCHIAGIDIVKALGLKVILIDRFIKKINFDYLISAKEDLGDQLIGVVLNSIPPQKLSTIKQLLIPLLARKGIKTLGTVCYDPFLRSVTISELTHRLNGKLITSPDRGNKLIENFLIGTMQVENFMTHFRKLSQPAVIVGGDRTDLQLVAIEGRCSCLILSGNIYPNEIILTRAKAIGIPLIVVQEDTYSVAKKTEKILESQKLRDVAKINHGSKLLEQAVNWPEIMRHLSIENF